MIPERLGSFVHGQFRTSGKGEERACVIRETKLCMLHSATENDIAEGLNLNHEIRNISPYKRAEMLLKIADLLLSHTEQLAQLIVAEMGKPIKEARGEVAYAASYFRWFAEEAKRIYGQEIPSEKEGKRFSLRYFPIGGCAVITPWNFPIAMCARKIAPALAAGCPVVAKPAPETPLSMLIVATLIDDAGFPPGTCNILVGDEVAIGKAMTNDPRIRKFSFTGSTQIGTKLYAQCAPTLKKVTLELGGNAPFIVCQDADISSAVEGAIAAKFRNSGQTCICANRLLVHENVHTEFVSQFTKRVSSLKVGNPYDDATEVSSYINENSVEKVTIFKKDAAAKGGSLLFGEKAPHEPEIITGVTEQMRLFSEETFGPLVPIMTFSSDEEAIRLANQTEYGLASYVFTQSLFRANLYTEQLYYGMVGVNDGAFSAAEFPFGGVKYSGFGREGGPTGLYEYLSPKSISLMSS